MLWKKLSPFVMALLCYLEYPVNSVPTCMILMDNSTRPCGLLRMSRLCCIHPKETVRVNNTYHSEDTSHTYVTFLANITDEEIYLAENGNTCQSPHDCWEFSLSGPNDSPAEDHGQTSRVQLAFPKHSRAYTSQFSISATKSTLSPEGNDFCRLMNDFEILFQVTPSSNPFVRLTSSRKSLPENRTIPALNVTLLSDSCNVSCVSDRKMKNACTHFRRRYYVWEDPSNNATFWIPKEDMVLKGNETVALYHCIRLSFPQSPCAIHTRTHKLEACVGGTCPGRRPTPAETSREKIVLTAASVTLFIVLAVCILILYFRRVARSLRHTNTEDQHDSLLEPRPFDVLLLYWDDSEEMCITMQKFRSLLRAAGANEVLDPHKEPTRREILHSVVAERWLQKQIKRVISGDMYAVVVSTPSSREQGGQLDPVNVLFMEAMVQLSGTVRDYRNVLQVSMDDKAFEDIVLDVWFNLPDDLTELLCYMMGLPTNCPVILNRLAAQRTNFITALNTYRNVVLHREIPG